MKRFSLLRAMLLCIVLIALTISLLPAQAGVGTVNVGITNSLTKNATITSNLGTAVKVNDYDNVGLELKSAGDSAGTGAITITFARSIDNVNWETSPRFTWVTALNGITPVVAYTNFPSAYIGAAGWIKVVSIANADANNTGTNSTLRVILKKIPH